MNKILLTFLLLLLVTSGFAQVINVSNVTTSGRFSQCSGAPIPTIQVSYVSGTGTTFSGGNIICNDPCGTTTVHVVIDSITWQQMPDAEWLHGIFLPANAGYTVSGINLPTGFVTYNNGCQGQCPVGISAGPGFYFDASAGNDCCGTILANDGYPCNNYGKTTLNCVNKFSLDFNLTFCNSILTTPTETFTLSGTSDGATGCWSYFTAANHSISFTVNVTPCTTVYNVPFSATAITRSCSGGIENFTTTLTGGCGNGNSVSWWSAATGGTLLGSGSPFVYDPAGSTCPGGQTIYASCCPGGTTSCIARQAVVIPGTCSSLMITGVNSVSGNCTSPSAINAVSVANSIGTVTYTLSPGNTSNTSGIFTGLVLGSYTVTVTDGTNCSATTAVSFTPISVPSLSLSNTTILCNAGTSTLTAVGSGTSIPYQYSLNGGALQSSGVFSGLTAGTYTVVVSDGNNCTSSSTIQITQPNVLTLGLGAGNIGCFGGSTTISGVATGGTMAYSYKLNAGSYQSSNSFTGITAGSYTVTVKDANNCTATSSITITQPTALAVSLSSGSILCNGGSTVLTANASGGTTVYQFSLNGSSYQNGNTFTVSSATYTVSVKDANNCTASSTIIITQPTPIVFGSASTNNVLCNGGSSGEIEILATGGTGTKTYTIAPLGPQTNTDGEFENLTAQCYTITAKDINNCSVTTVVCISQPTALTLTASSTAIACNAGVSTITCVAGGGTPSYQYQLNAGAFQTSSSFANNVAGTYTLTVKDANNCTKSTVLTITQPLALSLSVNASAILCNAGTSVITATAGGGTTAYQYSLNGGTYQSSNTFSSNASGTYTVTVKDANNCTKTSTVAITQPALLQIIGVLGTIPTCIPGNDATLSVSAIGGTVTLQYKINASAYQLSNQFSGLSASTYTITVKDANNCTATTVQAIMAPVLPVISSVSTTPILCFGNNTAQITVAASGMTSLTYQLLPNNVVNSTGVFNGLNAGAYTVVVTDGNSCSATSAVSITQPTLLTATASATAISCNAGQSTITVTANGGTTAYQYKLNAGVYQASNIFSNNNAGTYTITVQDANNCTTTTTVSIVQPTALTLSASATAILCNPGTSTITATAGGGTTAYQFSLNGGAYQSGNTFSGNGPGTYTINVKDAYNCTKTSTVSITQPNVLSVTASAGSILCNGGNTTITATGIGGTTSYQYSLNGGTYQAGTSFTNVVAGSYTVTIKDANNCTATTILTITQPTLLTATASSTAISCNAGQSTITVTANGGTIAYQYKLNAGAYQASNIFSNNNAGTYTITVQDANNCTTTTTVTIVQPTALTLSASATVILCNPGTSTITATAGGGTTTYQYSLNGGAYQSGNTFSGNGPGTYTIIVKDANNCTKTSTVSITQPNVLSVTASAGSILCNGGNTTITATGTGGTTSYQYSLNGGAYQAGTSFTNVVAGSYTVTIKDANNCTATTIVTITQPTLLTATASATAISCNAGQSTITVTANGGTTAYQYKLNAGVYQASNIFSNNNAGTYTIMVQDANSCTTTTTVSIVQPTALTLSASASVILCNPGTSTITATAGGGTTAYQFSLNGGAYQSGNTFSGNGQGTYTITVKDANNCTKTSTVSITQPNVLSVTASAGSILCNGGNTTITATGTGGTISYQYSLNGGTYQAGTSFTNVVAGSYTVTIKDANNCTATTIVTITQPTLLTATASATAISCNAGQSTITVTANGGTTAYQYKLNAGAYQVSNIFSNNNAGTYTITVQDANNCTTTTTVTIVQPTALTLSASATAILCNPGTSTITATAGGGTTAYQFSLNGGAYQSGNTFSGNGPGTYTITVKDANNCTKTSTVSITQPNVLSVTASAGSILCNGGNTTITATGTGGTTSYQYSLNGGTYQAGTSFTNVVAGSYTITIKDANNCTATTIVAITQPTLLTATASATAISCNAGQSTITVTANGGTTAYQYKLNAGAYQASNIFSNNNAGTYTITVQDANNCTTTTTVSIVQPTALTLSASATAILCNPGTSTITATAGGGTTAYQFSLNGGAYQSGNTFSGNGPGTYTITVKDANNCTKTSTVSITQPNVLNVTASAGSILCNGGNTTITATGTGGTTSYQYSLNGGTYQAGTSFTNVVAGSYTVTIKDANNCTATTIVTITQPTLLTATASATAISCNAGQSTITVTANGGTTAYQYKLNAGAYQSSNIFSNNNAGTYTITVQDANNCTTTTTVTIVQPTALTLSASATAILCNPGTSTITANAGGGTTAYQFSLNGGAYQSGNTFSGNGPGTYTITVKDANNCTKTSTVSITLPPVLLITNVTSTIPTCVPGNDASLTVTASGGSGLLQYKLNAGAYQSSNQFLGLGASTYTITVKDANNCTVTSVQTISNPNSPVITNASSTPITCNGLSNGQLTVTASGSTLLTYKLLPNNITNGTGVYTNLLAGNYTVVVTDANNCSVTTGMVITQPALLQINPSNTAILCNGNYSTISVSTTGGTTPYQYNINGGVFQTASTFPGVVAGTYTLSVKDANNCTASSVLVINQPAILNLSLNASSILCNGGSSNITATATGGTTAYQYQLNGGAFQSSNVFSGLSTGTYTIVVKDANDCTKSSSITIAQPTPLVLSLSASSILCFGGTSTITVTGSGGTLGYQYSLNGASFQSSNIFTNNNAGTYTITLKDANNCTQSSVIIISQPTLLTASLSAGSILCNGNTTTLTASANGGTTPYQYSVNGGSFQASNLFNNTVAGTYTLTVKDGNNCTVTTTLTVTQPATLTASASSTAILCNGGSAVITATGGGGVSPYQYSLNGGSYQSASTFSGMNAGTYTITVKDANNCTQSTTLFITQPPVLTLSAASSAILCYGGNSTITLTSSGGTTPYQYSLNGGSFQPGNSFTNNVAGTYTLTVKDANNCSLSTTIVITQPTQLNVSASASSINCNGGVATITINASGGTIPSYQYSLNGAGYQTMNVYNNLTAGTYTVQVYDGNNCSVSTIVSITQPNALTLALTASPILCYGGTTTINATATGGTPLYEYKLNSGSYQSAAAFTSITNGSYTITVKDANNCTKSSVVTITQPPLLQITAVSATQPTCLPGNDATLSITATGGTPLLQYSLNGGAYQNAATFNALAAGTYVVTVKDANNCTVSTSILISNPNSPVITNVNTTQVTCNGLLNGQILVTASGSSALTYSLQPVNTTNTNGQFTNLSAGNYSVVVSDINNCSVSSVVVINQPPILTATITSTPVLCYGNYTTISVNATGGTPLYSYQINGAAYQSSNQFPGVTAGTYTLQVKDANNCTLSSIYTVTQPAMLSLSLVADSILCFGGTSSITATGSGGTTAYQYSLNGSGYQTSNVFNGLVVGTYTVVLKDANDCTKSSAITIAQPSQLQVSASAATILCYGQTTTITITATGGAGGNLYSLNGSAYQSSSVFTGIAVGNYTATVKDANNCTASTVINISQPTQVQLTATSGMIACQGGTTTITAAATGGVPAYQYSLNGSTYQNGATFSGLVAGTYTVYSKDINNCTATQLVTLNEPSQVTLTITANAILCNGGTTTLVATATGGNTVYTYSLNNASFQTSNIYSSIAAGTYTIVVKDGNNCSSSSVITITEPSALVVDSVQTVVPTCIPGNDATLQVFASGGSSAYTFSIGGIWQTSSQFTGLASGAYTVVVKDANGCTKSSSVIIVPPNSPVYNSVVSTDVLCFGESNGTLQVTASGGIGSITYTLQPGNMVTTNGSFTNLSAGVYTITAQDANNCTVSTSIQINQPNLLSVSGIAGSIACNGGTTTLTLTANGGSTAYQYNLNGGAYQASTLFTSLVAGTYTMGVKDANNCTASSIVTINQPSVLTASVSALPILCYNGTTTLQLTASGATPAYQYSLNGGSYQSSATFANVAAGSYTITVIDANNCTVTVSTTISQPSLLSIDSLQTTSPTCIPGNDGTIIVYASGGTTVYQYSSGGGNQLSNVLTGLAPSTYTILVTDANGCTATSSITINAPNAPTIASVSTNLVSCFGGNDGGLQVTATGGFGTISYTLQPGLQSNNTGIFSALSAGSYTVVASDANNCSVSTVIQVVEPTQLTASGSVTPIACFGGTSTLTITANGGTLPSYQYSLNGSLFQTNNVYSNLSAGTFTVGVYDGNNCSTQFNITISQPPVLTLNLSVSTIACNGGSATITANASGGTGALVYSLNGSAYQSSNSFANLNPGVYTIVVMDANNCTTSSSISISQPGLLQLDSVQLTTPTCIPGNDGTVIVFASGGTPSYMYSAGGANQTSNILTGLAAGNYTITVTDLNGCTITQSITLNSPSAPQIDSILVTDVTCFSGLDGTITTFASGGLGTLTYLLNPGASSNTSGVFASLNANTYTITVTDVNQCTVTSIATINEPAALTTTLVATSIACYGGTAAITANANGGTQPYQYSLNGGALQSNAIFSGLPAATYTVMVTDAHNCTSTSTIQITEPTQVQLTLSANNIACNGGTSTITASASGGTSSYSYSLNGGAPQSSNVFTNITPGTYTIQVSDVNNCIATSTILITQPTLVQIDSSIYTTPTCIPGNDGTITVFASGGTPTYQYSAGGANQSSNVILGLSSGTFTITVTDLNGCTATAIQTILPPSAPIISSLSSTNISCFGGSNGSIQVSASGGLGTLTYLLTPGNLSNTTGNYSNLLATNYTVTVTDLNNCTVTTTINLTEPTPVQVVTSTADSVLCFGDANGSIQVVANGGTGVISYTLQPGNIVNTIGNFTNLTAGSYTVTGNDANGCSTTTQLTVYSPAVLQFVTVTHTDETCNNTQDASINATATGGSGVLTYSLQPGGQSNTTGIFTNLSGTTYTLVVTDAHACSSSTTIFIINPAAIALASLNHTDVLCAGNSDGTITATGTGGNPGGYTFTLQPGGSSNTTGFFNGLPTGTYTVTISDVKNCSASSTVVILTPSPINFVLNSVVDATCFGVPNGQVYTTITGGTGPFTYVIQPGGITNNLGDFTNVPAGTFTMTVTDANGCSSSVGPFTVNQPPAIVFNLISKKDVTCYGGNDGNFQISVNGGTGPKTLQLAPAIGTFTAPGFFDNLSSNTYTITATDGNGCTASSTVFINQNPAIVFDSIVLTSPTCHGDIDGKIHAFATGGSGTLYYQLNGGLSSTNGLFTGLSAATYTLSVNDQLGCLRDSIINLTEPDPIDFLSIDIKSAECGENKNGRIIITAMGGNGDYTYILRPYIRINKFGVFNDLEAGIYTITIKDYKGCLKDTVVEVNPPGSLMSLSIDKNNLGCFGTGTEGWAKVNVENGTPPYAYSWSTVPIQTSETATGLYFGYYFVDVVDARGCKQTDTVYIEPGPCCEEVFVPNAFSPNNDGVNDVFRVVTSAGIELIQFAIYNRWGNRVWSTPDFRRSWDGRDGGKIVDGNTYYYIFRYKCLTDGKTYIKKGDVTVMP